MRPLKCARMEAISPCSLPPHCMLSHRGSGLRLAAVCNMEHSACASIHVQQAAGGSKSDGCTCSGPPAGAGGGPVEVIGVAHDASHGADGEDGRERPLPHVALAQHYRPCRLQPRHLHAQHRSLTHILLVQNRSCSISVFVKAGSPLPFRTHLLRVLLREVVEQRG